MRANDQMLLPGIGLPRRLTRAVGRHWLHWRYLLTQRHRYNQLVLEHILDRPFVILPQVFNPKLFRSGEFLVGLLDERFVPSGAVVLDMGTGSGVGAVFAACHASRVVAVDINPHAVRCARVNALLNGVDDTVEVREGDLFVPVEGERFDLILFNPPYFRGAPRDPLDHAWRSLNVVERFAAELGDHLTPNGCALVVLSTDGDTPAFLTAFANSRLDVTVAARAELLNETLTVYKLHAKGEGQHADSL